MTTDVEAETGTDQTSTLIKVENLKKHFPIHKGVFSHTAHLLRLHWCYRGSLSCVAERIDGRVRRNTHTSTARNKVGKRKKPYRPLRAS